MKKCIALCFPNFFGIGVVLDNSVAKVTVTHEQEVTKEVSCENFLQAIRGDTVLLCQNPLTSGKHSDDTAAI